MTIRVDYRGDLNSPSGYSRANRNHVRALQEIGVTVCGINNKHDQVDAPLDAYWSSRYADLVRPRTPSPIKIWHETPEFYNPDPTQYNIAFVAWETTRIPSQDKYGNPRMNWVRQLNRMDEVWVPSRWNKKALEDSGVVRPICVMPHPIDLLQYSPAEKPEIRDLQGNKLNSDFTVLSVFQWTRRKNPVDTLVAFTRALGFVKDAKLVLKTYGSSFNDTEKLHEELKKLRDNLSLPGMEKNVVPVLTLISDKDMPDLYRSADCYFGIPMGEGFGMPFQEAMACGLPCIYSAGMSMDDFIDEDSGYSVRTHPEVVFGMGHIPWYTSEQDWYRAEMMHAVERLREAYGDWKTGKLREKGKLARTRIAKQHSFIAVGKLMRTRLEKIAARKPGQVVPA